MKVGDELGVHAEWDWVHERLFMPEGIKNVHALNPFHEPRSYIMMDQFFIRHYFADSYL